MDGTGANSTLGIGRATALQFARNGAKSIYICDLADEYLCRHKQELNTLFPETRIHVKRLDAADEQSVSELVQEVISRDGQLDIFFANAGIGSATFYTDIRSEDFMKIMRTNALRYVTKPAPKWLCSILTISVFLAAKYGLPAMKRISDEKQSTGGSFIATASVAGIRSNAGGTDYSASKAAVISIVQTLSFQVAGTGIRCNAVCPGIVETDMTKSMYDLARARNTENRIGQVNPLRRGAVADEIARVVLFLASDEASYVNGQAWSVCGGLSAGLPYVQGKLA